jgi:transposase
MMASHYAISDAAWVRTQPQLKFKPGDMGRISADDRLFINAVIWITRTGAAWRRE